MQMRPITWRLLSGYLPTSLERRNSVLERKRLDYHKLIEQYFHIDNRDEQQQDTFRQVIYYNGSTSVELSPLNTFLSDRST